MLFTRHKSYDRFAILAAAESARARGRTRKAIAEYRKILEVDPHDHETHGKIAPLLAKKRQLRDAWSSFVTAGEGYLRDGYTDKALAVYTHAARCMPRQIEAWETIARLQVERERRPDAIKALLDGSRHFRGRKLRIQGLRLLRRACEIEPGHFEATFQLGKRLAKAGEKQEARWLLDGLANWARGRNLRRVRTRLFWMSPTPAAAIRWLGAAISARELPFPRRSTWMSPGIRRGRRRRLAQVISLTIALLGFIAVGTSFSVDLGTQTIYVLVAGSGLAVVGLGLFLFF
jgi:tetratricopeptide (TPR) repeat protein